MPGGRQKAKVKSRARVRKPAAAPSTPIVQPEPHKPVSYKKWDDLQTSDEDDEQLQPTHQDYSEVSRMNMPPSVQREVLSQMEPSEDEADGDDTDSDTDSHSSEDSAAWGPKQASQQPGSSAASTSARSTAPAAARPAAPKPAASKFGFKSGFLTGAKANGAASSKGRSTHQTNAGNGIKEVSDEDSDEDLDLDNEGPTRDTAGSRAAKGPTGVQPLPNGKYTRAELASFEDSDAPPSLHSSEEPVTRMYYSDIDFATAKPANRGTASGNYASSQKAAGAGSAAPAAGGSSDDSRTPRSGQSSSPAARSAKTARETASKATPAASQAMAKYSPDQKRVAAAVITMLKSARRSMHPAAEGVLRINFGMHHPDTKPLLGLIPTSGDLPSLDALLELAGSSVLDGLERTAKLCIRSGMTALELFQKDCAFERLPDDTDVVEAVMPVEPQSAHKLPVRGEGGVENDALVHSHQIRPDLATLMSFMRHKVDKQKGKARQKYIEFYDQVLPGHLRAIQPATSEDKLRCSKTGAGIVELFRLKDTAAVPTSLVTRMNTTLVSYRVKAAEKVPCCSKGPMEHMFQFLIMTSAGDLKDDDDTERLFDLLMETVPHLDKPTLFLKEKGTTAQNSADASTKGAAPAGLRNPADIIQAWVKKLGAEGDSREAAAMAVLKMIETRELINSVQDGLKPTDKPVSQSDMFAFIEDLVPGVHDVNQSSIYQQGLDPELEGMDFVASHFCKIAQVYRSQIASRKKPHNELFDAKLARSPRLADLRNVRRFVRAMEVASSPLVAACGGRLQHPACLMKMEMPPPSAAGVELDQMNHPAIYTAFDRILSVFLESSDISQTSNRLKSILPGMEDAMRDEVRAKAGLQQGWLMRCAYHMLSIVGKFMELADDQGDTLRQFVYRRAAEAKLPHSEQLMEELLDNLIILPDALTPALLAMNAQKTSGSSRGLSARERELLAMEGSAYTVPWVGGEPLICQTDPSRHPLSYEDEAFIAQHARDVRAGKQPGKAAAAAPEKPEAQGSSRGSATPKQAPATKGASRGGAAKETGGLSAREQELLALEGSAYTVSWADGQPLRVQTGPRGYPLSMQDIDFIRQHACDVRDGKQPPKAAAAASEKPKAQGSSRSPAGSQQAPASRDGAPRGAAAARQASRDDDSDSLPDLMSDDELTGVSAAASGGPKASSSPGDAKHTASSREARRESGASVEDMDTIEDVDSDSNGDVEDLRAPSSDRPASMPTPDYPSYDMPYSSYPPEYWPESRLPKGVPEAEKARLREKMLKRREEQDAKAMQEKLAASQEAAQQAAERREEEERQKVAQKLIEEEEAAKKKAARQAEARQKKKAKKAKQRGLKQQKAPTRDASSDSEQGEDEAPGTPASEGQESQEHDLAAFAGLRVSESSASAKGAAKGKAESKQAPAKAQPKPAPVKAQKPEPPKPAAAPSRERVNGSAVERGPEKVMTAFGNVPRSAAPDASQSSSRSAAQQLPPPSKAPPLAPASEVLRELDAAVDSRDVDRLEEAIKKGDAFAKRAPINHFMAQVRQKLKQARDVQRRQLPTGAVPIHQAPRAELQQPGASAFPAAVQALFQRPPSPGHIPAPLPQHQRQPVPLPVPTQAASQRPVPPPIPPHLQYMHTPRQAPHVRPYQPPVPVPMPSPQVAQSQPHSSAQRMTSPARHQGKVAEMSQEWHPAIRQRANAVSMAGAQQGSEGDDEDAELCDICWERPKEIIFMPCGHRCTCQGCAADIMAQKDALCPLCRARIADKVVAKF